MTCPGDASMSWDYARYLAAKTTVDDRALNRPVLAGLRRLLPAGGLNHTRHRSVIPDTR